MVIGGLGGWALGGGEGVGSLSFSSDTFAKLQLNSLCKFLCHCYAKCEVSFDTNRLLSRFKHF